MGSFTGRKNSIIDSSTTVDREVVDREAAGREIKVFVDNPCEDGKMITYGY